MSYPPMNTPSLSKSYMTIYVTAKILQEKNPERFARKDRTPSAATTRCENCNSVWSNRQRAGTFDGSGGRDRQNLEQTHINASPQSLA